MSFRLLLVLCSVFVCSAVSAQTLSDPAMIAAAQGAAPAGSSAQWSTPTYLLGGATPATQGAIATFVDNTGTPVGAILILRTSGAPFPHDNRRCGAVHYKDLKEIVPFSSSAGGFYEMLELRKSTAIIESAVSLIATDRGSSFDIESKRMALLYPNFSRGTVWNIQLWTKSFAETSSLLDRFLTGLNKPTKPLNFINSSPTGAPPAYITSAQFERGSINIGINASIDSPLNVNLTVVTWTRPNPTPSTRVLPLQLVDGFQPISIPWIPALGTDAEIRIDAGGLIDALLVSVNHTGEVISFWQPFTSSGTSATLATTADFPPESPQGLVSLNNSTFSFSGTLANTSGFSGFYADFWPEFGGLPGHLAGFDRLSFYAKQTGSGLRSIYKFKIELEDARVFSQLFTVTTAFQQFRIDLRQLATAHGADWNEAGNRVRRIVIAAEGSGAQPLPYGLIFGQVAVEPPLIVSLAVNGLGTAELGGTACTSVCSYTLAPGSQITLTATPATGNGFISWLGSEECVSGSIIPTRNITCTAVFGSSHSVSGSVSYYRNTSTVGDVEVKLSALSDRNALTGSDGKFALTNAPGIASKLSARKIGQENGALTPGDAVYVMQGTAALQTLSAEQKLAGDVNGDGIANLPDASLILQKSIGLLARFPAAESCDSDWLFMPVPSATPNQELVMPGYSNGSCRPGSIVYSPLSAAATGQNFKGLLIGDVIGDWKPKAVRPRRLVKVRLGTPSAPGAGAIVRVPIVLQTSRPINSYSVRMTFKVNTLRVGGISVKRQPGIAHLLEVNYSNPAKLMIAMSSATPLPIGTILWLEVTPNITPYSKSSVRIDSSATLVE